jgi:hypothetical protein
MVEKVALIGPRDKIADDLAAWRESLVSTLLISGPPETLRMLAEIVG